MPKYLHIDEEIAKLRKADAESLHQYTVRLYPAVAIEAAVRAKESNQQMARALVDIITHLVTAERDGVVLIFDPSIKRQLDAAAQAIGVDRESLVRRIVGENLTRYLQEAVVAQQSRYEAHRLLTEVTADTESPAAPVKPQRKPK